MSKTLCQKTGPTSGPKSGSTSDCLPRARTGSVQRHPSRRRLLQLVALTAISLPLRANARVTLADPNAGDRIIRTESGLQYYDFVTPVSATAAEQETGLATGDVKEKTVTVGSQVTIEYTLGSTGARNGWKIEGSADHKPLKFRVGDLSPIVRGLDEGVRGMCEGGRRRLLIPASVGYHGVKDRPVPTGFAEYQRFKNIYLNADRPYLPDVVIDVTMLKVQ